MNKTALFLKTKHIGDSVILTSAIAALPREFKVVDVVCLPDSKEIFEMNPRVRNIFVIPRDLKGLEKWKAYINVLRKIINNHYHFLAQFSGDWRGAILSRYFNAELSVVRKSSRRGYLWHKSFNLVANIFSIRRHMAEQDVDLLRVAGLFNDPEAPPYQLFAPKSKLTEIKKWLFKNKISSNKKIVIIHAASRWKFKELPIATWIEVIQSLKLNRYNVILSGSKFDLDFNRSLVSQCKLKPLCAENFSIQDTAALYKLSDLVISIDSMSSHLASALQTPVVAIFGPTNEKNWAPWKVKHKVVSLSGEDNPSLACRPCGLDGCGGSKISHCLTLITPKSIIHEALKLLKR